MDYQALTLKDRRIDERYVSIQQDGWHGYRLEEFLGEDVVFVQRIPGTINYVRDFDADDYPDIAHWFMLDKYEHGSVRYTLAAEGNQCQWDTSIGCAVVGFPDWGIDDPVAAARTLAQEITDYINGDTFMYVITDGLGNVIDSCFGFLGVESVREAVFAALGSDTVTKWLDLAEEII